MRVKGTMEEKRNITFIIGNGFDLKYKLKTAYKHFLDDYLEIPSANGSIDAFKETIRAEKDERGYGNWSDLERQMGRYEPNTLAEFVECYDDIVSAMADYLRRTVRENIGLNADDIKNIPYFADGFLYFLIRLLYKDQSDSSELAELRARLASTHNRFNFILLNYTPVLSDCIKLLSRAETRRQPFEGEERVIFGDILQPHGDLNHIVFGVSDLSQASPRFSGEWEYRRRMIKSDRIKDLGESWLEEGERMIQESRLIAIYGTSLGETDNHWWRMLSTRLSGAEDCFAIIYYLLPDKEELSPEENAEVKEKKSQELINHLLSFVPDHPEIENRIKIVFDAQKFLETFVFMEAKIDVPQIEMRCKIDLIPASDAKKLLIPEKKDA